MYQLGYSKSHAPDRLSRIHIGDLAEGPHRQLGGILTTTIFSMVFGVMIASEPAHAQTDDETAIGCAPKELTCTKGDRVIYMPGFFSQYNPVTARDMVERVPGFSIDAGDNVRGFSGSAGNVLIDGQRPSTKSSNIFDILRRIGADTVARIELIRGGTGGLDVGGQAVVVNVILVEGQSSGSSSLWEFSVVKRRPTGGTHPGGEVSFSGVARGVKYTVGANASEFGLGFDGQEEITRFFGDDETRTRVGGFDFRNGGANLNLEKTFGNGDIARFNVEAFISEFNREETETRFLVVGGPDLAFFPFSEDQFQYEIGGDYEHGFSDNFDVKLIALYQREFEDFESGFEFMPAIGDSAQSLFISDRNIGETIGRIEFDWTGWNKHTIQFGGEIADNFTESAAQLFVDDGAGGLMETTITGANTRVSELRSEPFIKDSWRVGPKLTMDIGFALELSTISQSGDSTNTRSFTYPKPSLAFTYNVNSNTQWRLSGERKVNQLSFRDFISSVNFGDEDVDFGNPDLQPETTWASKLTFERRFGNIGVIKLTGFYDYINDFEDLLPLGGVVEVPGNIGNGTIWGGRLDMTVPLDRVGLRNARFEARITGRKSSVVDPVTGLNREFTFREPYFYNLNFRQDFPARKISWGWTFSDKADEKAFGLDELTIVSDSAEFDAFIETTVIKGVKVRLEANDVLNATNTRDRTVFVGSRALGVASFRELQRTQNGGGIRLTLSGTF